MYYQRGSNSEDNNITETTNVPCYYPFVEALEEIYNAYPNATFLFVTRNETDWLTSLQTYHEGFILEAWKRCQTKGFPGIDATINDFQAFYQWHKTLIRNFVQDHPSLTFIEIPLEADNTGQLLEEQVGIPQTCWGHHNKLKNRAIKEQTTKYNFMDEK